MIDIYLDLLLGGSVLIVCVAMPVAVALLVRKAVGE